MKIKSYILFVVAVILVMTVSLVLVLSISPLNHSHAKDDELAANFWKHQADFQKLVEMSDADEQVIRIATNFTWLKTNAEWPRPESEWGVSKARWDDYRSIFKKLDLNSGITREANGEVIYFIASSEGLITNGSSKGYAFAKTELDPIVDSLDTPKSWPKEKRVFFKQLKDNWYLFFSR